MTQELEQTPVTPVDLDETQNDADTFDPEFPMGPDGPSRQFLEAMAAKHGKLFFVVLGNQQLYILRKMSRAEQCRPVSPKRAEISRVRRTRPTFLSLRGRQAPDEAI